MNRKEPPGLFITGTDTGVGKTHVAAMIARALVAHGLTVGVYKPVASGCYWKDEELVSDDAASLWDAAGRPEDIRYVCPQRFEAPLAPNVAAREEGRQVDAELLRSGLDFWRSRSDFILVEGVGGLMSPVGDDDFVADLAEEFGYPAIVVARNGLGVIHQTLSTLIVAATFRDGIDVTGIILNQPAPIADDRSIATNRDELSRLAAPPVLAEVPHGASEFATKIDWLQLGKRPSK